MPKEGAAQRRRQAHSRKAIERECWKRRELVLDYVGELPADSPRPECIRYHAVQHYADPFVSALFSNGRQWRTDFNPAAQPPSIVGKEVFVEALHGDRAADAHSDLMLDQEFR